jgi:hypothetical protein
VPKHWGIFNMLPTDPKYENQIDCWKEQIKNHFNQITLSAEKKRSLEHMLLNASSQRKVQKFKYNFVEKIKSGYVKNQRIIYSHIATASLAAILTFGFINLFEINNHDFIAEMVYSMQDASAMPPDFDLVGDSNALPQLSIDSLPNQSFEPVIPKQLAQSYSAYEGRFFLYKGQQGVSITMEPNQSILKSASKVPQSQQAVLYIVKLTQKNEGSFPKQKVLKRIQSSSSKVKRIYAWRDGAYGYAMVQQQGLADSSNSGFADNVLSSEDQLILNSN